MLPLRSRRIFRLLAACMLLTACSAGRPAPPSASDVPTRPPPLMGRAVFVLPVHFAPGVEPLPGLDADLAYFLPEQVTGVRWVLQPAVEKAAAGSAALRIRPRELAVDGFRRMKLERIGDPLYGELHTLGLLLDARFALLPYTAAFVRDSTGTSGRVELGVALIDTSDGRVLWLGAVAGEPAAPGHPSATATAAAALARVLSR